MQGQAHPETDFGKFITNLGKNTQYSSFLDIGTWNGLGTTLCLVNGVNNRPGTKIYSIDANRQWCNKALENLDGISSCLQLAWGKLTDKIMSEEQIKSHPLFPLVEEHFNIHYNQDTEDSKNAPLAVIPSTLDVVVMDGGEFCGEYDMEVVESLNPIVICMCDTTVMKNNANFLKLLDDKRYVCLENKTDSKNGWAVFSRVYLNNGTSDRSK